MNARNVFKKPFDRRLDHRRLDLRRVLAAVQLRCAARVDVLVARWLARCAADAETAQRWFKADHKLTAGFGTGARLVVSPRWDESP